MNNCGYQSERILLNTFWTYREYGKRFNWLVDRVKLTRKEKYEFVLAVKNKPEDDVITFIREHPWLLSCMFWFDTYTCTKEKGTKTEHVGNCSCSQDLEICTKEGIDEDEIINRLEISIAFGMCPHLILAKYGVSVSCEQEITSADVFKVWDTNDMTENVRHFSRPSAGVYLIHLLILYCKLKTLTAVLPLYTTVKMKIEDMVSVKHHISPVLFAVAHYRISMANMIAQNFPHFPEDLALREPCKVDIDCLRYGELYMALMTNQFNGFTMLLPFHPNNCCVGRLVETWKLWAEKLGKCIEDKRKVEADLLLSPKKIPIMGYNHLFQYAYQTGCYSIYYTVLKDKKFHRQFLNRKQDVHISETLNEMMGKAVFTGDPNVVQLFVNYGFNVNATFSKITVLKWAEYLAYDDVCKVLESSKAFRKRYNGDSFFICLIKYCVFRYTHPFNLPIDPLPIIHQACESGNCPIWPFDALLFAFNYEQYDIVKYLLLRGCDVSCIVENLVYKKISTFLYLLIRSNAKLNINAVLKLYTKGIYRHIINTGSEPDVLDMTDDVAGYCLNANKEAFIRNNLQRTSIDKSEDDFAQFADWIGQPHSLKNLCRRCLRSTYRGAKYIVFMKSIKPVVPASIHSYLSMLDFLQLLLPASEQREIENKTKNAEEYILKCVPDHYELHLRDSNYIDMLD